MGADEECSAQNHDENETANDGEYTVRGSRPFGSERIPGRSNSMVRLHVLMLSQAVLVCTLTLAAEQSTAAEPETGLPVNLRNVVVVFKTHFDIGYTDLAVNVVQRYRTTMIDQALAVVDQNRDLPADQQFVWTLPGWPMTKISEDWEGQTSERQQRIRQAFRDGRFVVHALPFTTHTELLEPEDLVRGLGFASRLARDTGLPLPRDAKMTDVPCHTWIMPTLLRHAGVDFLHLGCNAASSSPQVPTLFWWEGPDGSRLLTMYSAAGYGTGLVPPPDWPYQTWLALIHTGDNHGPPTPAEVKTLAGRGGNEAARSDGPYRPTVRLRRSHHGGESGDPGGPRRYAGFVDPRPDVRSRRREAGEKRPAGHRGDRVAEHAAEGLGRRDTAGRNGDDRRGLRAKLALRRTHLGRSAGTG